MRLVTGFIVTIAVFVFVSVVGWVNFIPANDSLLLGTVGAAAIYWAVALVATLLAGLLGALGGAIVGALVGAISRDTDIVLGLSACGSIVLLIAAGFAADIYILLNLSNLVDTFPTITLWVAVFISLVTTTLGLLFNYKKEDKKEKVVKVVP